MSDRQIPQQPIEIGRVSGSHGLRGALQIHSYTRPISAISNYRQWWLGTKREDLHRDDLSRDDPHLDDLRPFQVKRCWRHGSKILATLENVANRSEADRLRGLQIFTPLDEIEQCGIEQSAEEESFLWHHLIGCSVTTTTAAALGRVCRIEEYGSADILVVTDHKGEWMIPFTESIITAVDIDNHTITVDLPDGMDACFSPKS
ncbi:MAG: ribosome maturation factor RimM [Mariprofundales bacterium]|nr:ribosome maturation factor RimM [Mariprofundales bacterium]